MQSIDHTHGATLESISNRETSLGVAIHDAAELYDTLIDGHADVPRINERAPPELDCDLIGYRYIALPDGEGPRVGVSGD